MRHSDLRTTNAIHPLGQGTLAIPKGTNVIGSDVASITLTRNTWTAIVVAQVWYLYTPVLDRSPFIVTIVVGGLKQSLWLVL